MKGQHYIIAILAVLVLSLAVTAQFIPIGGEELPGCDCDGGITTLSLQYNGPQNGVTVKVYNKGNANDESSVIATFNNVNSGDGLLIDATALPGGKLGNEITLLVVETGEQVSIHTSCSDPLDIGDIFGKFTLVDLEDFNGTVCSTSVPCVCEGGISTLSAEYTGQSSVTVRVFNGKSIDLSKLIVSFSNVNNGDELFVDGSGLANGKFKAQITFFVVETGERVEIHTSCSQTLHIGDFFGSFTLTNLEDVEGNVCAACQTNQDCQDNNVCNGSEVCVEGSCQPGSPLNCADPFSCTVDTCDPILGCINTPNNNNCDDQNPCTVDLCNPLEGDPFTGCLNFFSDDIDGDGIPNGPQGTCCVGNGE